MISCLLTFHKKNVIFLLFTLICLTGYSKPFQIRVHTDGAEGSSSPAESTNRGFCFNYVQQPCNSSTG